MRGLIITLTLMFFTSQSKAYGIDNKPLLIGGAGLVVAAIVLSFMGANDRVQAERKWWDDWNKTEGKPQVKHIYGNDGEILADVYLDRNGGYITTDPHGLRRRQLNLLKKLESKKPKANQQKPIEILSI